MIISYHQVQYQQYSEPYSEPTNPVPENKILAQCGWIFDPHWHHHLFARVHVAARAQSQIRSKINKKHYKKYILLRQGRGFLKDYFGKPFGIILIYKYNFPLES